MVAGHLREKNGYYHMVLNYVDEYGKRHTPSKSCLLYTSDAADEL